MKTKKYKYIFNIQYNSKVPPEIGEIELALTPLESFKGVPTFKAKWSLTEGGMRLKGDVAYYLKDDTLLRLCTMSIWDKKFRKLKKKRLMAYVQQHFEFEKWRAVNPIQLSAYERMIEFANKYGAEFKAIFNEPFQKFVSPYTGFDIVAFDFAIRTPDNVSLQDHLKKQYGDRAMELVKSLI